MKRTLHEILPGLKTKITSVSTFSLSQVNVYLNVRPRTTLK